LIKASVKTRSGDEVLECFIHRSQQDGYFSFSKNETTYIVPWSKFKEAIVHEVSSTEIDITWKFDIADNQQ
jgi:hypothetical protein